MQGHHTRLRNEMGFELSIPHARVSRVCPQTRPSGRKTHSQFHMNEPHLSDIMQPKPYSFIIQRKLALGGVFNLRIALGTHLDRAGHLRCHDLLIQIYLNRE